MRFIKVLWLILQLNVQVLAAEMTIKLKVENLSNQGGQLAYAVFNEARYFPSNEEGIILAGFHVLEKGQKSVELELILPQSGHYALAIYQDENLNQELDKNRLGIPMEKFGFSNNPSIFRGAPSFNRCQILLNQQGQIVPINLKSIF